MNFGNKTQVLKVQKPHILLCVIGLKTNKKLAKLRHRDVILRKIKLGGTD